jgi:hypothetical protein
MKWVFLSFLDDGIVSKLQYGALSRNESKKIKGNNKKSLLIIIGHAKYYVGQINEFSGLLNDFKNTEEVSMNVIKKNKKEPETEKNLVLYYLALNDKL